MGISLAEVGTNETQTFRQIDAQRARAYERGGGDPAEVTVAVAAEEESHLIVIGSRGFGTLERIAYGSVPTHVTRHAHCPVLLAK
ncbi:universal stress protein [Selenomonas sp. oral taxon 138]|uniref:universal stress protein n=1 Tax=Selenomonas sp. oral taxon 138 TaxID=712532 RepID=UPI0002A40BD6|nr:universal stress protein [Selenomonas sp. oral taxon 138]EKX95477.1 hypothetical protein HMPREF9163_02239 [Selenomonas sp. oral taxon 138 str. F0429]